MRWRGVETFGSGGVLVMLAAILPVFLVFLGGGLALPADDPPSCFGAEASLEPAFIKTECHEDAKGNLHEITFY